MEGLQMRRFMQIFSVGETPFVFSKSFTCTDTCITQKLVQKKKQHSNLNECISGWSCCEQLKFNLINQITLLMDLRKDWLASKRR